jgi:hypothetical protein
MKIRQGCAKAFWTREYHDEFSLSTTQQVKHIILVD